MTKKYYTGVGSRETPIDIQNIMADLAYKLAGQGWILRSGGAEGADTAFEDGLNNFEHGLGDIYIPWNGFNNGTKKHYEDKHHLLPLDNFQEALMIASALHPAWDVSKADGKPVMSSGMKTLHGRNCYQVLGEDLNTPSSFLVCWAETDRHGIPKGGTRTAWVLAKRHNIPCFNLYNDEDLKRIEKYLND